MNRYLMQMNQNSENNLSADRRVLVIGGGVGGIRAALDLADPGARAAY